MNNRGKDTQLFTGLHRKFRLVNKQTVALIYADCTMDFILLACTLIYVNMQFYLLTSSICSENGATIEIYSYVFICIHTTLKRKKT